MKASLTGIEKENSQVFSHLKKKVTSYQNNRLVAEKHSRSEAEWSG